MEFIVPGSTTEVTKPAKPTSRDGEQPVARLERLLTISEVRQVTSLSKASIYRLVAKGTFPPPMKLSDLRIAWRTSSIARWMSEREHAA